MQCPLLAHSGPSPLSVRPFRARSGRYNNTEELINAGAGQLLQQLTEIACKNGRPIFGCEGFVGCSRFIFILKGDNHEFH